ncbi:unnamed protein product [Mesocestoides corti]|uniref:Uncharacterized protein n=1 Tax=Mesocestoides corti TaxID=53468 RepID=A0A158QUE7_MESCO|nr:unnamed protein product [Mesocestoides corti]
MYSSFGLCRTKVSLFSLNHKTFYLNVTRSNIVRIVLEEVSTDPNSAGSQIPEVVVCSPSTSSCDPPLSVDELKTIVAECLVPPSPPPLPSQPVFVHSNSLCSPPFTSRSLPIKPNRRTPAQLKPVLSELTSESESTSTQRDQNWRLTGGRSTASAAKPATPSRSRSGLRALLRSNSIVTDSPRSVSGPQLSPSLLVEGKKTEAKSAVLDLLEDGLEILPQFWQLP